MPNNKARYAIAVVMTSIALAAGTASATTSGVTESRFCEKDRCVWDFFCESATTSTGCDTAPLSGLCSTYDCDDSPIDPEG